MMFEKNYGNAYGFDDEYFLQNDSTTGNREKLFSDCDLLILPKPVESDLKQMRKNQILWGWAHCVQQKAITQAAIDNELSIIAWEAMHLWNSSGEKLMHVFYKNNELAGYAAVLHSLEILGLDGHYGRRRKVAVLGYGSVSRGAIYALQGRGFNNINVYSSRSPHLIADQNPDVYYHHLISDGNNQFVVKYPDGNESPLINQLSEADIICNGVLQDTNSPRIFVYEKQVNRLKPRSIIIDISCDEKMGFSFAKPTTFEKPVFTVGENITYYSVDHTPSYLWDAASREISRSLIPFLSEIIKGPDAWLKSDTIRKAIEIELGVIKNFDILNFQKRKKSIRTVYYNPGIFYRTGTNQTWVIMNRFLNHLKWLYHFLL